MQQAETQSIKRRPDGSIDTAYYMQIGRQERSAQAHALAKLAIPKRRSFSLRFWSMKVSEA